MGPLPEDLLRRWGDLTVVPHRLDGREAQLWLVDRSGVRMVLRRLDPQRLPASPAVLSDRRWIHQLLDDIAATGFPAPQPIPDQDGHSLVVHDNAVWELLSYLDGVAIGWHPAPPLHAIGALLATLHDTTRTLPPRSQRPTALPIADISQRLHSASTAITDAALRTRLTGLADRLAALLDTAGHTERSHSPIHGDFTTHNVIAAAGSPRPSGVIDFGLAHLEAPIADIAYGLWRSGRPHQDAHWIEPHRATAWVTGYASVRSLDEHDLHAIPIYMIARGLQMVTKQVTAHLVDQLPLPQIDWLLGHHHDLADTMTRALGRQH